MDVCFVVSFSFNNTIDTFFKSKFGSKLWLRNVLQFYGIHSYMDPVWGSKILKIGKIIWCGNCFAWLTNWNTNKNVNHFSNRLNWCAKCKHQYDDERNEQNEMCAKFNEFCDGALYLPFLIYRWKMLILDALWKTEVHSIYLLHSTIQFKKPFPRPLPNSAN